MRRYLLTGLLLYISTLQAEPICSFQNWQTYQGTQLKREKPKGSYIFTTSKVKVDADGAPNAYHPDDVGLDCKKGTGFKGLDCPANGGYPNGKWWRSAIVPDPKNNNKGYIQADGIFKGYFISQTSLQDNSKSNLDTKKFVDSTSIPYIVFPGKFNEMNGTGLMGDFGYAINIDNGKSSPFIVAEVGPYSADLGEISIALSKALGGASPNPRTGEGAAEGKIVYVVFPYSKNSPAWPLTKEEIQTKATSLLNNIGGSQTLIVCANNF